MVTTINPGFPTPIIRTAYYDRNPSVPAITAFAGGPVVPHTNTARATYTVPANRKAMVTGGNMKVQRITVATTPVTANAFYDDNVNIKAIAEIDNLNTVGDSMSTPVASGMVFNAGVVIRLVDGDGSTGGTVSFMEALSVIEFDV